MQNTNEFWEEHPSADDGKTLDRRLLGLHKRIYSLQKASEILMDEFKKIRKMHEAIGDNLQAGYADQLQDILTLCDDLGQTVEFLQQSAEAIAKNRAGSLKLVRPRES
jgi:TPR repeat protein